MFGKSKDQLPHFLVVQEVSKKTGLPKRVVRKLLKRGWTYHVGYRHVPYFEHPAGRSKNV